jgi:hypothetical protein
MTSTIAFTPLSVSTFMSLCHDFLHVVFLQFEPRRFRLWKVSTTRESQACNLDMKDATNNRDVIG